MVLQQSKQELQKMVNHVWWPTQVADISLLQHLLVEA